MPDTVHIASDLESFYRRYIEIFNRQDTEQLIACFAHPYAFVSSSQGLMPVATIDEHRKSFLRAMTTLKNRGWARSEIDSLKAWPLGDRLAMIISDVTRYKTGAAVLESLRACYTLYRDGASWRIVTLAEIRPPFLGPGEIPYPAPR
jgi:hypothetical protein